MSNGERITLAHARLLADEFAALIREYALRVEVAGSIRRGKPDIGDLEMVVQAGQMANDPLDQRIEALRAEGVFTPEAKQDGKPRAWGERYKAGFYKGHRLDLFIVRPDRPFGVTFLIRTGPGDANELLVTRRNSQNRGTQGCCPEHLWFNSGSLWRLPYPINTRIETAPPGCVQVEGMHEEADVFAALGMPYIEPAERTVEAYRAAMGKRTVPLTLPVIPADQPIRVYTGRINSTDPDALNITIGAIEKGFVTAAGAALAPTRGMVDAVKDGVISETEYTAKYLEILRWRYAHYPEVFLYILARPRLVLTCYCAVGAFCHRHIAADVLEKIAAQHHIPFERGGELETVPAAPQESNETQQLVLFEVPPPPRPVGYGE